MLLTLDCKIEHIAAQTAAKRASQEEHDKALQVLKEVTSDKWDKGGHRKGTVDHDNGCRRRAGAGKGEKPKVRFYFPYPLWLTCNR